MSTLLHDRSSLPLEKRQGMAISLGWLLVIALGGGILVFIAIGLLLAWRLKSRSQSYTARVFSDGSQGRLLKLSHSRMKLSKKRLLGNEGEFATTAAMAERRRDGVVDDDDKDGDDEGGADWADVGREGRWLGAGDWTGGHARAGRRGRTGKNSEDWTGNNKFSSRISLQLLPPLPTYQSFFLKRKSVTGDDQQLGCTTTAGAGASGRGRKRSRSWLDEDGNHGPAVNRHSRRDSWLAFYRDSWLGRPPTLPNVDDVENGHARGRAPAAAVGARGRVIPNSDSVGVGMSFEGSTLQVKKKRRNGDPLRESKTEPVLSSEYHHRRQQPQHPRDERVEHTDASEEERRGRDRNPRHADWRPRQTDTGLKDILTSTEQRLRTGNSQSPAKTPRASPQKSTPKKTPKSVKTPSSAGSTRAMRGTPSPSKRTPGKQATPGQLSQAGSTTSISSAANSLIAEATQELELPGGPQSPSRALMGQEWTQQQQQGRQHVSQQPSHNQQQQNSDVAVRQQRRRSCSLDSDVSSSLSTVYSANEPEEVFYRHGDPFVDEGKADMKRSATTGYRFTGPRPLRRRSQTLEAAGHARGLGQAAVPKPLRTLSTLEKEQTQNRQAVGDPTKSDRNGQRSRGTLTATSSESSMETISVHTTDDDNSEDDGLPTPRARDNVAKIRDKSSPATPTKARTSVDISSSPLDDQEILRLLLSRSGPKRSLPYPPMMASSDDDGSVTSTPLSPRPKARNVAAGGGSPLAKVAMSQRSVSASSSNYDNASIADTETVVDDGGARRDFSFGSEVTALSRQSTVKSVRDQPQGVASTIAELRRMNSIVSSYSCASVASTAVGEADSTALQNNAARGGPTLNPPQQKQRSSSIGSKHYLSMGKTTPTKRGHAHKSSGDGKPSPNRPSSRQGHRRTKSINEGKENQGLGLTMPRIEISASSPTKPQQSPTAVVSSGGGGGGLREGRRSGNLSRDPSLRSGSPTKGLSRLGSVKEEKERIEEDDKTKTRPESLGLYDKDGFLIGSPDREKRQSRSLR